MGATRGEKGMLEVGAVNENRVLPITVRGRLTADDYRRALPGVEALLREQGGLRFFIRLEGFSGLEARALWEDLKFDLRHQGQYGKTAIVGEKRWHEWAAKLSDLLLGAEVRFFAEKDRKEAWEWVNG